MKISFKSQALAYVFLLALYACGGKKASPETDKKEDRHLKVIRIKGSETVRPVIEKVIEQFAKISPEIYVEYEGGGSNLGLLALKQQETDMAFVSRHLTEDERKDIDTAKKFFYHNLAYDGLSIIVHLTNPVKELDLPRLGGIYSGRIKNWKELGGKDISIVVYSRDISSGTYLFFREKVLDTLDYTKDDINIVHNKEIVNNVIQSPGAIGYVGHGSIDPNVKILKIAGYNKPEFIEPNYNTIKSGDYPLSRNLYYIFSRNAPTYVLKLDSFLKSPAVKQIIMEVGLIPH